MSELNAGLLNIGTRINVTFKHFRKAFKSKDSYKSQIRKFGKLIRNNRKLCKRTCFIMPLPQHLTVSEGSLL